MCLKILLFFVYRKREKYKFALERAIVDIQNEQEYKDQRANQKSLVLK